MMSPPTTQSFWNITPLDTKLKAFITFSCRTTQLGWKSKVHLMPWIIVSQPLLIVISNWSREKCVTKTSRNWRHKKWLVNRSNVSPIVIWWTPPKSLVMVKKQVAPKNRWNSKWNMVLCNMIIKLKQLKESTYSILWMKIILKVFKNHPRKTTCW